MRRFFLGCLLFLAAGSGAAWGTTLTASDVLTRARTYLRDQDTGANRQQFTDTTLLQFLSDGQREANAQNWLIVSSYTITLVQGTTEYSLPSDFIGTMRVWVQNTQSSSYVKIDQTSFDQLDARSTGWSSATGQPTLYYFDRSSQTVQIGFWPAPSVANSTGTVLIYYVQQTQDVTATTAQPFNGNLLLQPYVTALAYYVAYRGFMTVEETDMANAYLQYWVSFLQMMRQGTTKMPDFNPGFVGNRGP
jgi:hypothetical protein